MCLLCCFRQKEERVDVQKRQFRELEEMQKRQSRELDDFYRKLEQRKNDKLLKDSKRSVMLTNITTKTTITTQTVQEHKSSNGHSVKTTAKKQIHHSDENLIKLQQRSMQQFEFDASKKKGGSVAMGGWSTNKHTFNQMKGQPGTAAAMVMKGPRVAAPASSSSMPHIPQSASGYTPHTSSSMVFATPQNNAMHGNLPGQMHHQWHGESTAVYWTNGANQNWQAETGNGREQPITYSDPARHVTDMNSWQANGPYHPAATQPQQQMAQANNPSRTDGQMTTDNTKHVVLPSR
jgi:hypothetical protein